MYDDGLKRLYETRQRYYDLRQEARRMMNPQAEMFNQMRVDETEKQIDDYERYQSTARYPNFYSSHIPLGAPLPWQENMADEQKKQSFKAREVTVPELKKMLLNILKTNVVPFVWGPPGVGKSSVVKEIARENNWKIKDLRLSLLNPVDLRGLPTVDHERHEADWLPPSFLPKEDTKEVGILFLDEINLAPLSVQAAAYQLILDKQVGEYKFPKTWKIVAAGNREVDKANVFKLSAPLANRFVHFTVRPDFYSWKSWADTAGIHPTLIQFLALRPAAIFDPPADTEKAFPSPRSWAFVSDMLDAFDYDETDNMPDELMQVVMGAVGEGTGRELIEFFNQFKMQELTKRVTDFIQTGNITMPRSTAQRLTIIGAVFDAYAHGKLDQVKYDAFFQKLSGEEQATIKDFEERNADKLAKKFKNPGRMPQGGVQTTLTGLLTVSDSAMEIEDTSGFAAPGTALVIAPDGKKQEIIGYGGVMSGKLTFLQRGTSGGPFEFPIGSTVNKLS